MPAGGTQVLRLARPSVAAPPPPPSESAPVASRRRRVERYAGYSLHGVIARGGMATVWRATAPDGSEVALKRMLPALAANPQTVLMFSDEALLGMRLRHPRLIHTLALDASDGEPFLVMEYVSGPSVSELLNHSSMPLRPAAALHIVGQLLEGLTAMHELCDDDGAPLGVVHRDVSPNNILLTPRGDAVLGDFGIAQVTRGAVAPTSKALQGKVGYMAPEQLAGRSVDARTDLFAAGVVLLELLSGRRAFARDHELATLAANYGGYTRGLVASVPGPLVSVLRKALAQRREDRYPSARDFSRALSRAGRGLDLSAGRAQLLELLHSPEPAEPEERSAVRSVAPRRVRSAPARAALPAGVGVESRLATRVARAARAVAIGEAFEPDLALPSSIDRKRGLSGYRFGDPSSLPAGAALSPAATCDLLRRLTKGRASGLMIARSDRREMRVFFDDGAPVFVATNDESELLGERLVRLGHASGPAIELAVERAARWDCSLGEVLVDMGIASARTVFSEIRRQMAARLRDVMRWNSGTLGFISGARPGIVALRLCPAELDLDVA